jgi:ABC-2 type transport system ATP-binding protein
MWNLVRGLRERGVTIILTTHYIEEAEEMADRVGVINHGEIVLVERTRELMDKLGRKELRLQLAEPLATLPEALSDPPLSLEAEGQELVYRFDARNDQGDVAGLLRRLDEQGIAFRDLRTRESSLEEIFVDLVHNGRKGD